MTENEEARVIELYKYYDTSGPQRRDEEPRRDSAYFKAVPYGWEGLKGDANVSANSQSISQPTNRIQSPNITLTAFCQLAAIRLGVQRVGISLVGRYQHYILAEGTRTLNLANTEQSEDPEDALWMGTGACSRFCDLCKSTVELPPSPKTGVPPCVTVLDLQKDSRYATASFVQGPPFIKFFCSTPITTPGGFNIGCFWAMDTRLRKEFTDDQKIMFGTIAQQVMNYLDTTRAARERKKAIRMNQALSAFVDGSIDLGGDSNSSPLIEGDITPPANLVPDSDLSDEPTTISSHSPSTTEPTTARSPSNHSIQRSPLFRRDRSPRNSFGESYTYKEIYSRASNLIRNAMNLHGCVFFETGPFVSTGLRHTSTSNTSGKLSRKGSRVQSATMLGLAVETERSSHVGNWTQQYEFTAPEESMLAEFAESYPRGTLWTYTEQGQVMSSEVTGSDGLDDLASHDSQHRFDGQQIRHYFPSVRQLLFVPLFDASLRRITATCFAYSNDLAYIYTAESELTFLRNFITNVESDVSKVSAKAADKSKTDFIGSISHELRSPLHGILAAAEFLEETTMDSYQKSLIGIQVSCGKTLLQVIEHVLDYSKLSSLHNDEKPVTTRPRSGSVSDPMLQNLSVVCDLAEICEEVVEGSVVGRAHMSHDASNLPSAIDAQFKQKSDSSASDLGVPAAQKGVSTIIDVEYHKDWTYFTQPGAMRRILMNIIGNSLKYTAEGFISVQMKIIDGADQENSTIQLKVSDTGRGISSEFLRHRLFVPFNQEDHLSSGCGLGLSIVKALVDELDGTLDIQSELGVGTSVTVSVPMHHNSDDKLLEESTSKELKPLTDLDLPQGKPSVRFVGFEINVQGRGQRPRPRDIDIRRRTKSSISKIFRDWLQMRTLEEDSNTEEADYVVVLADEKLGDFIKPFVDDPTKKQPGVIALLPNETSRREVEKTLASCIHAFEVLGAPFGPRKIAKAVAACQTAATKPTSPVRQESPADVSKALDTKELVTTGSELLAKKGISEPSPSMIEGNSERSEVVATRLNEFSLQQSIGISDMPIVVSPNERTQPLFEMPILGPANLTSTPSTIDNQAKDNSPSPPIRVLLVDDNLINLRVLETFIKRRMNKGPSDNYQYDSVQNGLEAVQAFERNTEGYRVIFMDTSMPVMDGLEATRRIREIEKKRQDDAIKFNREPPYPATVVFLSGASSAQTRATAFANGGDVFMTKPTNLRAIGDLLNGLALNKSPANKTARL